MPSRALLALALAVVLAPAGHRGAQDRDTIPAEFARAVLMRGDLEPVLMPGRIPEDVDAIVDLPEGARLLGTVVYDASASVFLVVTQPDAQLRTFFARQFEAAGWSALEPIRRTGFVAEMPDPPAVFCSASGQVVTVSFNDRDGASLLTIGYVPDTRENRCTRQSQGERIQRSSFQELRDHMPVLSMPEGEVRNGGEGTAGRGDGMYSSIEIVTDLSVGAIAEHVAGDLDAQGWQPDAGAVGERSAIRTWLRSFEDGFRAFGELMIMERDAGSYRVEFRMTMLEEA